MKTTVLPVQYPFITPYQHHTTLLSILTALYEPEVYMPWFCSNYIQLRVVHNPELAAWVDFYSFLYRGFHMCPLLDIQHIHQATINNFCSTITEFLIKSINEYNYIYLVINCEFISMCPEFHKFKSPHPILIYGYDEEQKIFHTGGFYFDEKFSFSPIPFVEMDQAFRETSPEDFYFDGAKLIRPRQGTDYATDIALIKSLLQDYINGYDTRARYRMDRNLNPDESVGMEYVYRRFSSDLVAARDHSDSGRLHLTSFHVFLEHKKALYMIVQFLKEQGFLQKNYDLFQLEKKAQVIRNLILKYIMSGNLAALSKAEEQLHIMYNSEKNCLSTIIEELEELKPITLQ